jgi:neurofibromin 1
MWCGCVQVVFFMYLWSIDLEAVVVAMSCFALLCQEADVRCGTDEGAAATLLPNYTVYQELAVASTSLTTGQCAPP